MNTTQHDQGMLDHMKATAQANREYSMERTPKEYLADIRLTVNTLHSQAERMYTICTDPEIGGDKLKLVTLWLEQFLKITEGV
jgi:hypothetical protein